MKKVLILLTDYFPNPNAITLCMQDIIDELIKDENSVDVVCFKRNDGETDYTEYDGKLNIIRVNAVESKLKLFIRKVILKIININNNKILYFRRYSKKVKTLFKEEKYDLIISTSFPFCMHELASKMKIKTNTKWIAFQFDPYSYNHTCNKRLTKYREYNEIRILKDTDAVILPQENLRENLSRNLSNLEQKYKTYYYKVKDSVKPIENHESGKTITFCGYLYNKIREPFNAIDIISKLNANIKIKFYYKCTNEMNDRINKTNHDSGNKILLYRNKSKNECKKALENTDILLNIGNSIFNQTPSKIFEYISTGKPIINFYESENDTSYNVLKKYNMACNFNIKVDKLEKIETFISEVSSYTTYEEIKKIYKEECNSSKIILNYIKEIIE